MKLNVIILLLFKRRNQNDGAEFSTHRFLNLSRERLRFTGGEYAVQGFLDSI